MIENRDRNIDLIRHNAAEREVKVAEAQAEKELDKKMVEEALARERAL
jgi:hypothetical protein